MKHLGDITKINGAEIPVVDVITGGSPCQDLSVAGKRAGLQHGNLGDEETTRSGLFMEQLRVTKEMREHDRKSGRSGILVRPRYMVWENVPGALSSPGGAHKGKDFKAVLTEIVRVVEPNAPDVPMPEKGGWPHAGVLYDELGGVVRCLSGPRRSILGRSAEKKTDCSACRFQRTQRSRNFI